MKILSRSLLVCLIVLFVPQLSAKTIKSLILYYDEVEQGVEPQLMRYLVNDQFLRIDNGDASSDFILFDVKKQIIYSVNHQDKTVLLLKSREWKLPMLDFKVTVNEEQIKNAPEINNQAVYTYQVKADDQICTQVFLIKNTYADKMQIFYQYQQLISGEQVAMLNNTPVEMRTPCFLLDQVYHAGDYFKLGLPVQISYSRGYEKFLKNFSEEEVELGLFVLPVGYGEYSAVSE